MKNSPFIINLIACAVLVLAHSSIFIYLPAAPIMQNSLQTDPATFGGVLTYYLIGNVSSMLFWGPISELIGRRVSLLISMGLFIIATVLILFSHSILWILYGRFLQGLAAGSVTVARSILRDVFTGKTLVRAMANMSIAFVLALSLSPFLGGLIIKWLHWRWEFGVLLMLSFVIALLVWWFLPETLAKQQTHWSWRIFLKNYQQVLRQRQFLCGALAAGFGYTLTITYNALGPALFQLRLGVSPTNYGILILLVGLGYLLGALFTKVAAVYYSLRQMLMIGLCLIILASGLLLALGVLNWLHVWSLVVLLILCIIGQGIFFPNAITLSLMNIDTNIGYATAFFGFVPLLASAFISGIIAYLPQTSLLAMASVLLMTGLVMWLFTIPIATKNIRF